MPGSLLPITREQFVANLDDSLDWLGTPAAEAYSSVLPPWAQSGPWGWPLPYYNEMLFGFGKIGAEAVLGPLLNPLENAVEQVAAWIVGLKSWLDTKQEDCESADDYADAIEEYADANNLGSVWDED
jgi:hypothetical protein